MLLELLHDLAGVTKGMSIPVAYNFQSKFTASFLSFFFLYLRTRLHEWQNSISKLFSDVKLLATMYGHVQIVKSRMTQTWTTLFFEIGWHHGMKGTYNKAGCGFVEFKASLFNMSLVAMVDASLSGSLLLCWRPAISPTPTWMLLGENFATSKNQ